MVSPWHRLCKLALLAFALQLLGNLVAERSNFTAPSFRGSRFPRQVDPRLRRYATQLSPAIEAWKIQQERDRDWSDLIDLGDIALPVVLNSGA